jgi:hypothetical protein
VLFRYLRSNFLFWFGGIFMAVGLIAGHTHLVTAALVFLGGCFFIPGAVFAGVSRGTGRDLTANDGRRNPPPSFTGLSSAVRK